MARKKMKPPTGGDPWDVAYIESLAWHQDYVKDARKVLNKGGFGTVESRADGRGWWVKCKGMTDTYQVSVRPDPQTGFDCTCNCPSNKYPCKHALALLLHLAAHPELRIEPVATSSAQSADLDALVRAVFDNPEDDTPRLVLADCCEELGQSARAALIRLQCELARTEADERLKELREEQKKLMPAVRTEMGPIPDDMSTTFDRGFVKLNANGWWGIECDALPAKFPELFRDGWVEIVSVRYGYELPEWVFGLLRQVREVDFSKGDMTDRDLVRIASDLRPGAAGARLRSVRVPRQFQKRYQELTAAAAEGTAPGTETATGVVEAYPGQGLGSSRRFENLNPTQFALLVHAGHLRGAQYLGLSGEIGDEGIRALLAAPGLDELVSLELTNSGVGPDGMKELAASPHAGRLQWLAIHGSTIGDALASALRGAAWPRLIRLSLTDAKLTDTSADALSRCECPALGWLDVSNNALTRAGAAVLLDSARLKGVKDWILTGNPIPTAEWIPLVLSGSRTGGTVRFAKFAAELSHTLDKPTELHLSLTGSDEPVPELLNEWASAPRAVVSLMVSNRKIDAAGIDRLATALTARRVRELHVDNCALRNEAAVLLAKRLADLKLDVLDLRDNEIGKGGAEALAAAPGLATVRVLQLSGNPLRASGVDALVASPHLKALKQLALPGKDVPAKRQKEIRAQLGKGVVVEFV